MRVGGDGMTSVTLLSKKWHVNRTLAHVRCIRADRSCMYRLSNRGEAEYRYRMGTSDFE